MNIKDIARICGVSPSSVSRVINNKPGVKPEVKEKIEKILRENKYRPNRIARGLVSKKSNTIGILLPRIHSYYAERLDAIIDYCKQKDFSVVLATSKKRFEGEAENFYLLYEKQVEGILYFSAKITEHHIAAMQEIGSNIPIVMVDRSIEELNVSEINYDNTHGTKLALEHLIKNGHRKIAFIGGAYYDYSANQRFIGYLQTLMENGITARDEYIKKGDFSTESGYALANEILDTEDLPTAIFAASDGMAIGVINAIGDRGLKVPDDISVIGYDNIEMASFVRPTLTTIHQDQYELGTRSVKLLFDIIENFTGEKIVETLMPELVVRKSVKKI